MPLGLSRVMIPRMKKILDMFAPSTFPETISEFPDTPARMPETSSGNEVPMPTINTPIAKGDSPMYDPSFPPPR